ncbi:MAG: DNA polymerase III subunit delta [Rhizobiaceae bacterium]|nr:DNA polymerase III subunit delta [Rhizobiaceae bacterium]
MAQKKSDQIDAWIARPDAGVSVVLLYGPDRGLVSERAAGFVKAAGFAVDDPFSLTRLSAEDVDRDPGRLIDEMRTLPMFSDRRLVWYRAGTPGKGAIEAVRTMTEEPPAHATLLIEAGDLRKGAALRTLVEGATRGMALPCYADEAKSLDTLIDQAVGQAGVSISLEARQALKRNLGGDRLASRGEIEKLVLYARGLPRIELDHVEALAGDAAGLSVDEAVDSIILGRPEQFDIAFQRASAAGQLVPLLLATVRQFQLLQLLRDEVEINGKSASAAIAGARPPIFFARKHAVEAGLSRWSAQAIRRALDRLQAVILGSRERAALAEPLIRQALLGLALAGRPGR